MPPRRKRLHARSARSPQQSKLNPASKPLATAADAEARHLYSRDTIRCTDEMIMHGRKSLRSLRDTISVSGERIARSRERLADVIGQTRSRTY
jgi:hypothetical protein